MAIMLQVLVKLFYKSNFLKNQEIFNVQITTKHIHDLEFPLMDQYSFIQISKDFYVLSITLTISKSVELFFVSFHLVISL